MHLKRIFYNHYCTSVRASYKYAKEDQNESNVNCSNAARLPVEYMQSHIHAKIVCNVKRGYLLIDLQD